MDQNKPQDVELHSCKLCKKVLKKTQVTICCMSRFCKSCITDYGKAHSNQCPTCKKAIADDSIRADEDFDTLIELSAFKVKTEEPEESTTINETVVPQESEKIQLALFSINTNITKPELPDTTDFRYAHVVGSATIGHVAKFLEQRHLQENGQNIEDCETETFKYNPWTYPFTISCKTKESNGKTKYCLLPKDVELFKVRNLYKTIMMFPQKENDLELYYTYKMPPI